MMRLVADHAFFPAAAVSASASGAAVVTMVYILRSCEHLVGIALFCNAEGLSEKRSTSQH